MLLLTDNEKSKLDFISNDPVIIGALRKTFINFFLRTKQEEHAASYLALYAINSVFKDLELKKETKKDINENNIGL
jgi:hypothetical protein